MHYDYRVLHMDGVHFKCDTPVNVNDYIWINLRKFKVTDRQFFIVDGKIRFIILSVVKVHN